MSTDDLRERIKDLTPVKEAGPMPVISSPLFKLKVRELKAVCEKSPKHPKSIVFAQAIAGLADTQDINVEKADLEAVLDNKDVEVIEDRTEDGRRRLTKKLVPLKEDRKGDSGTASPEKAATRNPYNDPSKNDPPKTKD